MDVRDVRDHDEVSGNHAELLIGPKENPCVFWPSAGRSSCSYGEGGLGGEGPPTREIMTSRQGYRRAKTVIIVREQPIRGLVYAPTALKPRGG